MAGSNATKPTGSPVIQFAVMLPNRAGALEGLIRLLHQSRVEIVGLSVQDSRDATVARLITSDPDITMQVFLEKGVPHTTCEMVVVAMRDPSRGLQDCLRELHLAETNIEFAYSLLPHPQGKTLLAFHVEDYEFGCSVLHNAGLPVLCQDDLSR